MVLKYISTKEKSSKFIPAVIDLKKYSYETYMITAKHIHKGSALRHANKAKREGFFCELFEWSNFIPDIFEINTSKEMRSGGKMREAYFRTIDELGGIPKEYKPIKSIACSLHHTYNWGIFKNINGYKQGNLTTNKKLLGYIKFKRNGNLATYTSILGHGDYLKFGIMYELHYSIISWVYMQNFEFEEKIDFILYGSIDSGNKGLKDWKKRCLFNGTKLIMSIN